LLEENEGCDEVKKLFFEILLMIKLVRLAQQKLKLIAVQISTQLS
jgi:hypothetical protein